MTAATTGTLVCSNASAAGVNRGFDHDRLLRRVAAAHHGAHVVTRAERGIGAGDHQAPRRGVAHRGLEHVVGLEPQRVAHLRTVDRDQVHVADPLDDDLWFGVGVHVVPASDALRDGCWAGNTGDGVRLGLVEGLFDHQRVNEGVQLGAVLAQQLRRLLVALVDDPTDLIVHELVGLVRRGTRAERRGVVLGPGQHRYRAHHAMTSPIYPPSSGRCGSGPRGRSRRRW